MIRQADFGCEKQKFLFTTKIEHQRQISVTPCTNSKGVM
jgi:hypothetical protein